MIGLSHAPVHPTPDRAWLLTQIAVLTTWLAESGHRWPPERIARALNAITAGRRDWRELVAEAGR